jgi:hypothetical protein
LADSYWYSFYVLSRTRSDSDVHPKEIVSMTGSTGNIYKVTIAEQPVCDCPQGLQGKQCKHIVFVLKCVLHARDDLVYQLALLPSELHAIFRAAQPIVDPAAPAEQVDDPRRKPIDGDCPICFNEMDTKEEAIVWCKAACGQNIHKECFEMWAATKRQDAYGPPPDITCPYCRSMWQGDDDLVTRIKNTGTKGTEGYVNVAKQLGISAERGERLPTRIIYSRSY